MIKLIAALAILILSAPAITSAEIKGGRLSCIVCGMYIDQYQHTSAELTLKNGEKVETCGVSDMLRIINDKGGPDAFPSIMVHDWNKTVRIPAAEATYVIGSRIIPDMTPNIIAFENKGDAESFKTKEGGEILNFTQALLSISPMMMTMPTRIKTAVLSPKGASGVGIGYMHMTMDKVKLGSDSVDPLDFVKRPGQMMGPRKMTSNAEMLMINYGITDDLSVGISESYFEKKMETYKMGGKVTETSKNSGFGDIDVTFRYNLWKNAYYSKFFTLLAGTTLPTGDFKREFVSMSGLQTGNGAFTFTGGLLFSHRYKNLWFHYMASYTAMPENGDDYKFGDTTRFGAAVHYTPNYSLMAGLEIDGAYATRDKYLGVNIDNTGGFRSNLSGVAEWKFLTAFGGTFSIRASGGIPIYEDLNHFIMGASEKAKLGGGYFVTGTINFSKRFQVN
ncbi:MAG: nitrous oxide reductase accessory protein NosL [Thermodesulfovibrionales bacterium]